MAIEGRSIGKLQNGKSWDSANFTVIYDFEGELISRVAIYLDPDYVDDTQDHYPWKRPGA